MSKKLKLCVILIFLCFNVLIFNKVAFSESDIRIEVDADKVVGEINPFIFGNSILGDGTFSARSNYGEGIWDPIKREAVTEVIRLARGSGMSIARYPGGSHANYHNWKKTIGLPDKRPGFLFGLDEFMKTTEEIGCDVVYTLPYFTGTPQDAADLVEYLNAPLDGRNPGGGIDWAKERAKNGHPAPYNVKYFELGNEIDRGYPQKGVQPVDPEIYAGDYNLYRDAMSAIDNTIKLGAVTVNSGWSKGLSAWNERLFKKAGGSIDFLIEHTYYDWLSSSDGGESPDLFFATVFNNLSFAENYYMKLSDHFKSVTGRSNIPIAVTEYNSGFKQQNPVPLRHTLGTALFNAALLQTFMKPENNILMANYWQFVNSHWGMIKNDQYVKGTGEYIKRPNYYVFEMFQEHFDKELVNVNIHNINPSMVSGSDNLLFNVKWKTKFLSGEVIRINNDVVEIVFSGKKDTNFFHVNKKVEVKPNTTYELSGKLRAEGLVDNEGVGLQIVDGRGWGKTHSAVGSERVWGTTKWIDIKTEYTTLSDASEIMVLVRRVGGAGIIKGKIFVKDINLTEKKNSSPKGKDAVSVSASISNDRKKLYLMVLNKNVTEDVEATVRINKNDLIKDVDVWTLNGPSLLATNERSFDNVIIKNSKVAKIDQNDFQYSFPPHSLTSIEINVR